MATVVLELLKTMPPGPIMSVYDDLSWLRPRRVCPGPSEWLTVAATGDRSNRRFEDGIWAPPPPEGHLELVDPSVDVADDWTLLAGLPEWTLQQQADRDASVEVVVGQPREPPVSGGMPLGVGPRPGRVLRISRRGSRARA